MGEERSKRACQGIDCGRNRGAISFQIPDQREHPFVTHPNSPWPELTPQFVPKDGQKDNKGTNLDLPKELLTLSDLSCVLHSLSTRSIDPAHPRHTWSLYITSEGISAAAAVSDAHCCHCGHCGHRRSLCRAVPSKTLLYNAVISIADDPGHHRYSSCVIHRSSYLF